jgi:hypothetical protein
MTEPKSPFDGSRNLNDIRTFYTSELSYLKAMRKRYACAFCGDKAYECVSCARTSRRIAELEKEKELNVEASIRLIAAT